MKPKERNIIRDLQCTMADLTYQEYLDRVYSLSACSNDYDEGLMEEYKLRLGLVQSQVMCPSKQPKVQPITHHGRPI